MNLIFTGQTGSLEARCKLPWPIKTKNATIEFHKLIIQPTWMTLRNLHLDVYDLTHPEQNPIRVDFEDCTVENAFYEIGSKLESKFGTSAAALKLQKKTSAKPLALRIGPNHGVWFSTSLAKFLQLPTVIDNQSSRVQKVVEIKYQPLKDLKSTTYVMRCHQIKKLTVFNGHFENVVSILSMSDMHPDDSYEFKLNTGKLPVNEFHQLNELSVVFNRASEPYQPIISDSEIILFATLHND